MLQHSKSTQYNQQLTVWKGNNHDEVRVRVATSSDAASSGSVAAEQRRWQRYPHPKPDEAQAKC